MLAQSDCFRLPIADKSVHCIVTSPPYWGLRKYAGEQGAEPLGLEPTPERHIERTVEWAREVWRVLRDDGVFWMNYGDCYAGSGGENNNTGLTAGKHSYRMTPDKSRSNLYRDNPRQERINQGNLMLMPHRIALALQADTMDDKASIPGGEMGAVWLAAMIDGEGTLGIRRQDYKGKDWNSAYAVYIAVKVTDRPIIDECVRVSGLGRTRFVGGAGTDSRGIVSRRDRFEWRLDGAQAVDTLQSIYPYLLAKKRQALLLFNLHLLNQQTRGHRSQSSQLLEQKKYLYELVKRLNQREACDLPNWIVEFPEFTRKPRWIVRQDLVWSKPNPMPESVAGWRWKRHRVKVSNSRHATDHDIRGGYKKMLEDASVHQGIDAEWLAEYEDCAGCEECKPNDGLVLRRGSFRHTRAHEYVFMLTKGMHYWSDQEAVREPAAWERWGAQRSLKREGKASLPRDRSKANIDAELSGTGRNPRSVLHIPTAPYRGAHYATFPPALIAPLILATCPRWCCPVCGQGWAPIVERPPGMERNRDVEEGLPETMQAHGIRQLSGTSWQREVGSKISVTGYRPTCDHPHTQAEAVPGIVFDPFVGSGTTVMVARQLGRQGIGLDLSRPYLTEQAAIRIDEEPRGKWKKQLESYE